MMAHYLLLVGAALAGTLLASFLACIPALHIYNLAGLLVILALKAQGLVPGEVLALFMLGLVVGYAMLNTIPGIFFGAPDDSTVFVVLPGQKYLMQRRGYEASVLTGVGGLGGLLVLLLLSPLLSRILPVVWTVVSPHLHWILGAIALYMLLSEWPKDLGRGRTRLARFLDTWSSPAAGLLTFLLSGLLGLVLFYGNLVPADAAFQNLLPAFAGLFALPWLLQNLLSGVQVPEQHVARSLDLTPGLLARGVGAGAVGGLFAAFFPAVSGGIGGLLAGQASAQRDDRLFLVSQGASKLIYYVGALLLFFVPGLHMVRGGMASMLSSLYTAYTPEIYWLAVAASLLCGALAFLLLLWFSRLAIRLVAAVDYRYLSAGTIVLLAAIILTWTGWGGLLVAAVATAIGLLPVRWGSRRMNCMGVLLLPLTLSLAGLGPAVAAWLGLA
jgi:putative membrane protein